MKQQDCPSNEVLMTSKPDMTKAKSATSLQT
jgi:hypothetical protein